MPGGSLNLEIVQGEDWTVQIQSLDDNDNPKPIVAPARMDIRDRMGAIIHSLQTADVENAPADVVPGVAISSEVALIQLHIPRSISQTFDPGPYHYDLWVTVDDGGIYAGSQAAQELRGQFIVHDRVTKDY